MENSEIEETEELDESSEQEAPGEQPVPEVDFGALDDVGHRSVEDDRADDPGQPDAQDSSGGGGLFGLLALLAAAGLLWVEFTKDSGDEPEFVL